MPNDRPSCADRGIAPPHPRRLTYRRSRSQTRTRHHRRSARLACVVVAVRGAQISRYRAQFARNIDVQTSFTETLLLSLVDADNDDHNADDREDKRKRRPRSAPPVDCFLLAASLADSAYADLPGDDRGDPSGPDIQNRMGNRPTAALIRPGDQTGEADAVGLDVLDIDHLQLRWLGVGGRAPLLSERNPGRGNQ